MDWNATSQGATNLWRNWIRIKTIQSIQDNATLLMGDSLPAFPTQVIQMFQQNITFWFFDKRLQRMCKTHLPSFFQNNRALSNVWFISIALKLSSVILRKFCSISSEQETCANTQFSREHSWSFKKNKVIWNLLYIKLCSKNWDSAKKTYIVEMGTYINQKLYYTLFRIWWWSNLSFWIWSWNSIEWHYC